MFKIQDIKTLCQIHDLGRKYFKYSLLVLFMALVGVPYLLREGQDVVGFAIRMGSYLHFIAIHPKFKGKGYGKRLIKRILPKIRRLRVNVHNKPAIALYSKFGFKITGTSHWFTGRQYIMERVV